jgi:hypothetical protein
MSKRLLGALAAAVVIAPTVLLAMATGEDMKAQASPTTVRPVPPAPAYQPRVQVPQRQAPQYQVPVARPPQYQVPQYQAPRPQVPQYQVPARAPQYQVPQYQAPRPQVPQYQVPARAPQYQVPARAPQYQVPQYQVPARAPQYQAPARAPQYQVPARAPQYQAPARAPQYQVPQQPRLQVTAPPYVVPAQHAPIAGPRIVAPPRTVAPGQTATPKIVTPSSPITPVRAVSPSGPRLVQRTQAPTVQQTARVVRPAVPAQQIRLVPGPTQRQVVHVVNVPPAAPKVALSYQRVEAARQATPVYAQAIAPPARPVTPGKAPVSFAQQVSTVVANKPPGVKVVNAHNQQIIQPAHWPYLDYDQYYRPTFYNPAPVPVTIRYPYGGAFHEAYLPVGQQLVLDAALAGVYAFTVVGDSYLMAGNFLGGAWIPPAGWDGPAPADYVPPAPVTYANIPAVIPAAGDEHVQLGKVTMVGHDSTRPAGSQDAFMVNDSTLAYGSVPSNPSSTDPITLVNTQTLPGVGPVDQGQSLIPTKPAAKSTGFNRIPWAIGAIGLAGVLGGVSAWVIRNPEGADDEDGEEEDSDEETTSANYSDDTYEDEAEAPTVLTRLP